MTAGPPAASPGAPPVAGVLAAWGSALLGGGPGTGAVAPDDLLHALGPGTRHYTVPLARPEPSGSDPRWSDDEAGAAAQAQPGLVDEVTEGLLDLLARWRRAGTTVLGVAFPRPGAVNGQPGPGPLVRSATDAGQCVFALDGYPRWAAVPEVVKHGNALEGWATTVRWHVTECDPVLAPATQVSEADQGLKLALLDATRALVALDVARWRPELADRLTELRSGRGQAVPLPPGWPGRAARLLTDAHRLQVVLDLALADEGGAVTVAETARRREALSQLSAAVHQAWTAGWNAHAEPVRKD